MAPTNKLFSTLCRMAVSLLTIGLAVFVGFGLLLYLGQEQLLFIAGPGVARPDMAQYEWMLEHDGVELHGWRIPAKSGHRPALIYFGGNGERMSFAIDPMRLIGDYQLVLIDYRGYGLSTGTPGEVELKSDALAIYDALVERGEIDPGNTHVMGRSLGTGVAIHLAAHREVSALVLVSPYDSVDAVAGTLYPMYPTRWLVRHPFRSIDLANLLKLPVLVIRAATDNIVPPAHTKALYDALPGPKKMLTLPPGTHHNHLYVEQYFDAVSTFLDSGVAQVGVEPTHKM
ncbi:MAG: alpha/beta hydrolase [Proteobacteria bacterium]|nr:alpha/beta hydrolase [Pseudomonadota bacterium]